MHRIVSFCSILLVAAAAFAKPAPAPVEVPVKIVTVPAHAEIAVDGQPLGATPRTVLLAPGTHSARLSAPGVPDTFENFEVDESTTDVPFRLPAATVSVLLVSEPEGATVTRNGSVIGTTPKLLPEEPAGRYEFEFSLNGYRPHRTEIDLAGPAPRRVAVKLVSSSATLHIESEPAGADVSVNGTSCGKTPAMASQVPEGESTVLVSMPGYKPFQTQIRLSAGDEKTLNAPLEPVPSVRRVVTIPAGARIYLNDEFKGVSPVELRDLAPGSYRLRTDLADYDPVARTIQVAPGSEGTEEFRLNANVGFLALSTAPADVTVVVDGKEVGKTKSTKADSDILSEEFSVQLLSGDHELLLSRPGFASVKRSITVKRAETTKLETVKLARKFIPDVLVETVNGTFRGVYVEKTVDFYRMETSPGITKSIPHADIIRIQPIRNDN